MTDKKDTVKKISNLAHLKLSDNEIDKYAQEFEKILQYVEKLEELDTEEVEPLSHVHDLTNVLRDDQSKQSPDREKHLENAPERKGPYFQVPRVIEDK